MRTGLRPPHCRPARLVALLWLACGCTDTTVYTVDSDVPPLPDRVALSGTLCTEDAGGSRFPVKILYVLDSSAQAFVADPERLRLSGPPGSLQAQLDRNRLLPNLFFGIIAFGDRARLLPRGGERPFYRPQDPELGAALAELEQSEGQRRDLVDALARVQSAIESDLALSSPGDTLRTRYLVHLMLAGPPTGGIDSPQLAEQVSRIREQVLAAGALEMRLHTSLLYYGPRSVDTRISEDDPPPEALPFNCYPQGTQDDPECECGDARGRADFCRVYCDIDAGRASEEAMERATINGERMAQAGGGRFRELPCPATTDLALEVQSSQVELTRKEIVVYNRNLRLGETGPEADSDGDGLSDREEMTSVPPTDPLLWDTDGDGLGDRVELRTFPRQDPNDPTDRPAGCADPAILGVIPDRDFDLLNDCEEQILETRATVPDSDGDGLPDALEFFGGTLPASAEDRELDFDFDQVDNGTELLEHTDPRADDGRHRREAYRYDLVPLGPQEVAEMEDSETLRGVSFRRASPGLAGGQGLLRWRPCDGTLAWSDARIAATPPYVPEPATIEGPGVYRLSAVGPSGQIVWVEVQVTPALLPTCADGPEHVAQPRISVSQRNCWDVQVTNVKLALTQTIAEPPRPAGLNDLLVFFTQAPVHRLDAPGIASVASIPVQLACIDPAEPNSCRRDPPEPVLQIGADDFVTVAP